MLDSILSQIRCPVSRLPLARGDVAAFNAAIARGEVRNTAGRPVVEPAEDILIAADQKLAYIVRDGIPILLPEESVPAPIA